MHYLYLSTCACWLDTDEGISNTFYYGPGYREGIDENTGIFVTIQKDTIALDNRIKVKVSANSH